jgi:hypothetical protein
MHDRSAWTKAGSGPQTINGKSYKNLVEFKRPCATCGEPFSIFVTNRIASGHADSNSFGLKNCEQHRRGGRTNAEEQAKDLAIRNLRDECESHLAYIQELKAELALYKPPTAQEVLQPQNKMPWQ